MLTNLKCFLIGTVFIISACRATAPQASGTSESRGFSGSPVRSNTSFPATKEQEQSLFLRMLAAELKANVPVSKDQQHHSQGLLECIQADAGRICHLKARTAANTLSADQEVPAELSSALWEWTLSVRPELENTSLFSTEVRCTFMGKKSPPYDVEDVRCQIEDPGLPNEAYFKGPLAEEMSQLLGGPSGSLICRVAEGSGRRFCLVRRQAKGLQQDHIAELSMEASRSAFESLLASKLKSASAVSAPAKQTVLPIVTEIPADISCWKTGSEIAPQTVCRSRLR